MISRDRLLNTLKGLPVDRPPFFMNVTPQIGKRLVKMMNSDPEEPVDSFFSNRISFPGVLTRLGNDCVAVAATSIPGRPADVLKDGTRIDEWGIRSRTAGWYSEMVGHPLAEVETAAQVEALMQSLRGHHPGTRVVVTGGLDRPPMERTPAIAALFTKAQSVAADMGITLTEGGTGGGSDGNLTSALGVPTLDGMGAVGDGGHSVDEYVVISALPERAAILAGMLCSVAGR